MKHFELPFLKKVDVENITEEQGYLPIDFQNREIVLMWFAEEEIDEQYFLNATKILGDLNAFNEENGQFLRREFNNKEDQTVLEYLEFHLEELPEEWTEIIEEGTTTPEKIQKLLAALKLQTIAFHDDVIVADYVLNKEISDQVLAISINLNGEKNIAWES
ncbi:DUF2004 domain-containing protein [Sphingobacterium yanglingense]|uniref:Uncharacterized protein DUF2004 n=1 Tax=Sphingobacterium yanglingense TaxID=1437280 RepID=A0A4V3DDU8_9SPHI|nr:DUF2004 domain-containing protein [Sphingobacterium yanglingense]TDQ78268.1 uncharacterized protein DUF2004 [Sphingobacterium yanglingense]